MAVVRECAPEAKQILNDTNRGFSAAVNQGLRVAHGEFVFLLNPDAFLEPDYLAKLVAALTDTFGMATGTLLQAEAEKTPTLTKQEALLTEIRDLLKGERK